jgi:hypothetical protein
MTRQEAAGVDSYVFVYEKTIGLDTVVIEPFERSRGSSSTYC